MKKTTTTFVLSSLLLFTTCSKDEGYNSNDSTRGNSYSYSSSSYNSAGSSSAESTTSSSNTSSSDSSSSDTSSNDTSSSDSSSNDTSSNDTSSSDTSSSDTSSNDSSSSDSSSSDTSSSDSNNTNYSFTITAQNSSDYIVEGNDQNGNVSGNDPSISVKVGDTINLDINASGHPLFLIISSNGGFGSSNLVSGVSNNGAENGSITWSPSTVGTYYYICEYHSSMIGVITVTE
jgi:plastocyanin